MQMTRLFPIGTKDGDKYMAEYTQACKHPLCDHTETANTKRVLNQLIQRHEDHCNPDNRNGPDLKTMLDRARDELGEW